jgi:hypothetical protein
VIQSKTFSIIGMGYHQALHIETFDWRLTVARIAAEHSLPNAMDAAEQGNLSNNPPSTWSRYRLGFGQYQAIYCELTPLARLIFKFRILVQSTMGLNALILALAHYRMNLLIWNSIFYSVLSFVAILTPLYHVLPQSHYDLTDQAELERIKKQIN